MKTLLRTLTIALVAAALVGLPLLPDAALQQMAVSETSVPLAFAAGDDGDWVSAPVDSEPTIVGLTWETGDEPESAELRVRVDGSWSDWEEVPIDDEHAPDPGSDEALGARGGTSPVVVEGADAVQFRVDGPDAPERVVAELIEVDDPDAQRRVEQRLGEAQAAPGRPSINNRQSWNGSSCVDRDPDDIVQTKRVAVLFVHHTASHTSYSASQVPSIIRGICSYHVNSRGWDDIGYNALVDRYGRIWQGRQGVLASGVRGAHTGGFNDWSHGVALIGDHSRQAVTPEAQSAIVAYGAWYLDLHNVDPRRRYTIESAGSSRWSSGRDVTFDAVSGHRAASYTACPGDYCLSHMGSFMRQIDERGGFKTYGGWTRAQEHQLVDGSWQQPVIDLWFDEPARWSLEIRDQRGRRVMSRTGTGSSATVKWDARVDGRPASSGRYSTRVTATAVSTGRPASPADHDFHLTFNRVLSPGTFEDVPVSDVFFDDIRWLSLNGITRGCNPPTNTQFCATSSVTRAEMAAFLNRAAALPDAGHAGFSDVPRRHKFAQDVANIAAAGITVGCGSGRFCPDDAITRQEMAAFLVRASGVTSASHPGFRDVRRSSVFETDIRRLATAGITFGCNPPTNDRFCPWLSVTRGEMAAFIRRAGL